MIKRFLSVFCCFVLLGGAAALAVSPLKLAQTIKDYALKKNPDWQGLEIRVTFKQGEKSVELIKAEPDNAQLVIADGYGTARAAGETLLPVTVKSSKGIKKYFVRARISALKNIAVAARPIKRGATIMTGDLTMEARDVATMPRTFFTGTGKLVSSEAKTNILKDSVVLTWMVRPVPVIKANQETTILVMSKGLLVRTKGKALQDGYVGDSIRVQRLDSRTMLTGAVNSAGQVEVELK